MGPRRVVLSLAVVASALIPITANAASERAVIELFTSQGCSSCPAADELAGELAKDPSLIVLSLAIDYWDYLGWKDTLALPGHGNRQKAYARMRGDRQVYTPQAVINGTVHVVGSDREAIDAAIAQTDKQPGTLALPVAMTVANGTVTVTIPAATGAANKGEIWLCPISSNVPVAIGRGENSGRTITYHNVVRRWVKLGDWTGAARTLNVPLADVGGADIDSFAVVVQAGTKEAPGNMLGAAVASAR